MSDDIRSTIMLAAAIGAGLNAGVFFAFSTFVMPALSRRPAAEAAAAMQAINIAAINPWFMAVFLGTAVLCLGLLTLSVFAGASTTNPWWLWSGCMLYLAGTFLVTMVFNVPRNDALAAVRPASAEAALLWTSYLRTWTAWNHVRTVTSLAAALALTLAWRWAG